MKGLLYKKLVLIQKVMLPGIVALLILTIGMEYMNNYFIDESIKSADSSEATRTILTVLSATIGFLFIFLSGAASAEGQNAVAENKFNILLRTFPVSDNDIVTSEYISMFVIHIIGFVMAAIYFTAGYFVGIFANPIKDYWQIAVMLFFTAWLSEIIIMPFMLAKVNAIIMFVVRLLIYAMPIGAILFIGMVSMKTFFRIAEWINEHITVILIFVTAVSSALTPLSYFISKRYVKGNER